MAQIYCPKCHALTSDSAEYCPACGANDPAGRWRVATGALVAAGLVGAVATIIYGRLVYLAWPRWLKVFGGDNPDFPEVGGYPQEAAVLFGVVVFFASTMLAFLCLRPSPARATRAAGSPAP